MSKLRSINTHFWQDNYILDLDPIEKLLFLYLLSNTQTNMLGIYELNIRRISFDTGIDKDMILKIFGRFTKADKVKYIDGYVVLRNFIKHQSYNPNMETSAVKAWNELPFIVRNDRFCEPIIKGLKGFIKGSEPIAESEYEYELEYELESPVGIVANATTAQLSFNDRSTTVQKTKVENKSVVAIAQPKSKFIKPTIQDVIDYFTAKGQTSQQAQYYYDYRESVDWTLKGGQKLKNWKSDVNVWVSRNKESYGNRTSDTQYNPPPSKAI